MIEKATDQPERSFPVWKNMMHAIWWISVLWLALAFALIVYFLVQWLILKDDPLRYETVIVSATLSFFSFPAGIGVLVTGFVPKTGLSTWKRAGGIALLVLCVGVLMLHDYLAAKYR